MALVVAGTDFIQMPAGTTAQRPVSPIQGMQRYNTDLGYTEVYSGGSWVGIGTQGAAPSPTIASTAEAQAGTNNTNFITPLRMREGFNASGSAPVYACRAWVRFDGTTSPGTINASGNVSSVTRPGTGSFTVNFTTAIADADYSVVGSCAQGGNGGNISISSTSTGSFSITTYSTDFNTPRNIAINCLAVFR